MENTCVTNNKGHGMPFAVMQQSQQFQLVQQQQQQLLHSVQHLTPPPQHTPLMAPSSSLVRPATGIPLSPAASVSPVASSAADQGFLIAQDPNHVSAAAAHLYGQQQRQQQILSSSQLQQQQQHSQAIHPASVPYYYNQALYIQQQARKNSLRNDVFLFNGRVDPISDASDAMLGRLPPASPALSPPLSPTEFLTGGVTETNAPLFDYETRDSVEFPVPDSPSADVGDGDVDSEAIGSPTKKKEQEQEKKKTPKIEASNTTTHGMGSEKDPKTVMTVLKRHLFPDELPTPPELQRMGPQFGVCIPISALGADSPSISALISEESPIVETPTLTDGARKRKASTVSEASPLRNATLVRKRRANSTSLADIRAGSTSIRRRSPKSGTLSMIKAITPLSNTNVSSSAPVTVCSSPSLSPSTPSSYPSSSSSLSLLPTTLAAAMDSSSTSTEPRERAEPRSTQRPTIFELLTEANVDWCRYCGTTEGVNWRPGPWGKRTLCNKHGCDYKGYGFACKLPRLNLTAYQRESIYDRERPVLQHFCCVCHSEESWRGDLLVCCEGCPKAYHQRCYPGGLADTAIASATDVWHCTPECSENRQKRRIVVELPRKRLPLMRSPKDDDMSDADSVASGRRGSTASLTEEAIMARSRASPSPMSIHGRTGGTTRRAVRRRPRPFYGEDESEGQRPMSTLETTRNLLKPAERPSESTVLLSGGVRNTTSGSVSYINGNGVTTMADTDHNDFGSLLEEQFRFARRAHQVSRGVIHSSTNSSSSDNDSDEQEDSDNEHGRNGMRKRRRKIDPEDEEMDVAAALIAANDDEDEEEEEEDIDDDEEDDEEEESAEYVEDSYWA